MSELSGFFNTIANSLYLNTCGDVKTLLDDDNFDDTSKKIQKIQKLIDDSEEKNE